MNPTRRKTVLGLGSLAFGSGAVLSSAAFNSSTDPTADLRVTVSDGLEVRAGQAFNDDGSVNTGNSDIDPDNYIDPDLTGDTVGEDFYDGGELGPVFDDRDPPLATVSARSESEAGSAHAGVNDDLEIYVVPSLENDTTFTNLLEIVNLGNTPVERIGISYDRTGNQYGSDVTIDDFGEIDYPNEIGPLGVQRMFQFIAKGSINGRLSPNPTEFSEPDAPDEQGIGNELSGGGRFPVDLRVRFPESWTPFPGNDINLKRTVRNVATSGNPFAGGTGVADLLDEITVGVEDPDDPFFD